MAIDLFGNRGNRYRHRHLRGKVQPGKLKLNHRINGRSGSRPFGYSHARVVWPQRSARRRASTPDSRRCARYVVGDIVAQRVESQLVPLHAGGQTHSRNTDGSTDDHHRRRATISFADEKNLTPSAVGQILYDFLARLCPIHAAWASASSMRFQIWLGISMLSRCGRDMKEI